MGCGSRGRQCPLRARPKGARAPSAQRDNLCCVGALAVPSLCGLERTNLQSGPAGRPRGSLLRPARAGERPSRQTAGRVCGAHPTRATVDGGRVWTLDGAISRRRRCLFSVPIAPAGTVIIRADVSVRRQRAWACQGVLTIRVCWGRCLVPLKVVPGAEQGSISGGRCSERRRVVAVLAHRSPPSRRSPRESEPRWHTRDLGAHYTHVCRQSARCGRDDTAPQGQSRNAVLARLSLLECSGASRHVGKESCSASSGLDP